MVSKAGARRGSARRKGIRRWRQIRPLFRGKHRRGEGSGAQSGGKPRKERRKCETEARRGLTALLQISFLPVVFQQVLQRLSRQSSRIDLVCKPIVCLRHARI